MFFLTTDVSGIHHHVVDISEGGGTVKRTEATSSSGNSYSAKITDWASASACDTDRYAQFFWGMLERGFYFPCSQFEAVFMSTEITEGEIQETLVAAKEVFRTL